MIIIRTMLYYCNVITATIITSRLGLSERADLSCITCDRCSILRRIMVVTNVIIVVSNRRRRNRGKTMCFRKTASYPFRTRRGSSSGNNNAVEVVNAYPHANVVPINHRFITQIVSRVCRRETIQIWANSWPVKTLHVLWVVVIRKLMQYNYVSMF